MRPIQALTPAQGARCARAFQLLAARDVAAALALARPLAAEAPRAPDAQHLLALCLAAAGDSAGADQAFAAALALAPGQPVMLANRARFLRRCGRGEEALACWTELCAGPAASAEAWTERGLLAHALGRREEARIALQTATRLDPRSVRAWHGLGAVLRDLDQLPEAEAALRQALALDNRAPALWASLGGVLRLLGRPESAAEAYVAAKRLGPVGPEVHEAEVGVLIDCLRIDEARDLGEALVAALPDYVPAHTTLANLYFEFGPPPAFPEDPAGAFRAVADARQGNADLQLGLIAFLLQSKQAAEARERLQALRARHDDPRLVALEANACSLLGERDAAAALYAEADRGLGASDVSFNNAYVRHLLACGEWRAAAERAERTRTLAPHNQETLAYLATAWRLTGDAREDWLCGFDRLVELMPVDAPAGQADMVSFLPRLRAALEPLHQARHEPVAQSLRGGSQTPGRLFGRPVPEIEALRQALLRTIERWLARLPEDAGHPFLQRRAPSVRFTGSWSVKLWQSGSHANHFHSEGWMSSAFYVALPPSVSAASDDGSAHTAGALQLGQPPVELGLDLPPRRLIQPREGHLALFPSYLWHGTVPFDDAQPRITVAFDMQPRSA